MSWYKTTFDKAKGYASSFWYDDYDTSFDYLEQYGTYDKVNLDAMKKTHNLYKLSSVRRAISNFVQIVTNKSIPVTFATKSESKTDGKKVILSADVDDNFDVSVGLALHEGSHIVLSDFRLLDEMSKLRDAAGMIPNRIKYMAEQRVQNGLAPYSETEIADLFDKEISNAIGHYAPNYIPQFTEVYSAKGKIGCKGFPTDEVIDLIQGLTNWIEDRRIDHYIYNSAPGYRDYYVSMYDHYFNDKVVTKGVQSDEFTDETFESYMFRIINILNEETDLGKLKGLRTIYRKLDLKNIARLKTTTDSLDLAIDVLAEILRYVPVNSQPQQKQKGPGQGGDGDVNEVEITDIEDGDGDGDDQMGNSNGQASGQATAKLGNTDSGDSQNGNTKIKLSKTATEQLKKKFQKQKEFLNNELKKKKLTNAENDKMDSIQESGTEMVRVGNDYVNDRGEQIGKGVDCIVVKKLTPKLMEDEDFPFTSRSWRSEGLANPYIDDVKRGVMLGTLLGKKLQIRSEYRDTIFSRLKKGKIDGRMVASLGYDNENVFFTKETDQFKKANLHISIDYSGSMSGEKIRKAIVSTVAIVKACEMSRTINTQVSIRSTENGGRCLPYVALVHDSRRDTFRQFCDYMSKLQCTNTTPEGLCFEAIMKELVPSSKDTDSYFLNFSDGQPTYSINHGTDSISYGGSAAATHTHKQVKKMQANGMNILSYFITEYGKDRFENSSDWQIFKKCYGKDAKYVNVENMFEVAKTMNEMFLKKD